MRALDEFSCVRNWCRPDLTNHNAVSTGPGGGMTAEAGVLVARSGAGCTTAVGRILRLAQGGLGQRGRIELEGLHRAIATITQAIEAAGEALVAVETLHHVRGCLGSRDEVYRTRSGITRDPARVAVLPGGIDRPLEWNLSLIPLVPCRRIQMLSSLLFLDPFKKKRSTIT